MVSSKEISEILKAKRESRLENKNLISCKTCNAKNINTAKFCTKCDSKLVLKDSEEKTEDILFYVAYCVYVVMNFCI